MTNPNPNSKAPSESNTKKKKTNTQQSPQKSQQSKAEQPQTNQSTQRTPRLATSPPIESSSDYPGLLEMARTLTKEERSQEFLECARYGEVDAVRAILETWGQIVDGEEEELVNTVDSSRNTALHKAAANGHLSTVSLLLSKGSRHVQNENGATPLHWAAGAGKGEVCQVLLDHFDALSTISSSISPDNNVEVKPLDVLLKNSFGRSALTEAFASGDTQTVGVLLNHDSAEEEKLIGGLDTREVDAAEDEVCDERGRKKEEIVHEFDFRRGFENAGEEMRSVFIRELPIAHPDNPFGRSPREDTTGLSIWCASLIMARWLSSPSMTSRLKNKHVLELGAGCAVPSLSAMVYGTPASVTISDLNRETIENIRYNIELNKKTCEVTACSIDWEDETTYPERKMDYVICSDCIYQKDIVPLLKKVVMGTLKEPASETITDKHCSDDSVDDCNFPLFLYVAPEGGRDGLLEFITTMKSQGFTCIKEEVATDSFGQNPLKSGDDEECFLHFHELASTTYVLYEFQRC